jgi:hypothetical protein
VTKALVVVAVVLLNSSVPVEYKDFRDVLDPDKDAPCKRVADAEHAIDLELGKRPPF